jgi:hypothetical protein
VILLLVLEDGGGRYALRTEARSESETAPLSSQLVVVDPPLLYKS